MHSPDAVLISTARSWLCFVIGGQCARLSAYCGLDDALELATIAGEMLAEARTGRSGPQALVFSGSQYLAVLLDKRT